MSGGAGEAGQNESNELTSISHSTASRKGLMVQQQLLRLCKQSSEPIRKEWREGQKAKGGQKALLGSFECRHCETRTGSVVVLDLQPLSARSSAANEISSTIATRHASSDGMCARISTPGLWGSTRHTCVHLVRGRQWGRRHIECCSNPPT